MVSREATIELPGSSREEVGGEVFNRITDIFILSEHSLKGSSSFLKGPSGSPHSTVKYQKALQIPSENSVLGLVVLSSD